jgi:hypothetical protein
VLTPRQYETDRLVRKGLTTMWDSARRACVERLTYYKPRLNDEILDSMSRVGPIPTSQPEFARAADFMSQLFVARPSLAEAVAERPDSDAA